MDKGKLGILLLVFAVAWGCAPVEIKREVVIPEEFRETRSAYKVTQSEPPPPEYQPLTENLSSIRNKIVDIVARSTPLKDVIHVIAEATGLNLLFEKDVDTNTPITLTLKGVTAEDALNAIFNSLDYTYSIKDNILSIKARTTIVFEMGRPLIVQNYSSDIGGDILGSVLSGAGGGAGGAGGGGSANLRGGISQTLKSDPKAFNYWDNLEAALMSILGIRTSTGAPSFGPTTGGSAPMTMPTQQIPTPTGTQPPSTPIPMPGTGTSPESTANSLVIDRSTGTILITATKKRLQEAKEFLDRVKRGMNRQIVVEAKIIEVSLSDRLRYGIDWEMILRTARNTEIMLGTQGLINVLPPDSGLPSFNVSVVRGTNIGAFLNALAQVGEVRTLSNPRVNILNGQTALLTVGRNINFISRIKSTVTQGTPPIVERSVDTSNVLSGIMLGLNPFIDENGDIFMTITPIVSDLIRLDENQIGSGDNTVLMKLPIIDLKQLSTVVKARDGETIIIGGLISKKESLKQDKVPFAGDVPIAGEAFKAKDKDEYRTEMLILLQSHLIAR